MNKTIKQQGIAPLVAPILAGVMLLVTAAIASLIIFLGMYLGFLGNPLLTGDPGSDGSGYGSLGAGGVLGRTATNFPECAGDKVVGIGSCLNKWLAKNAPKKSPLQNMGHTFAQEGKNQNVNPALLIAIADAESSFGTNWQAIPKSTHNYQSQTCGTTKKRFPCVKSRNINKRTWSVFPSWEKAVQEHAYYMRWKYLDQGITSIEEIGKVYVGHGGSWVDIVTRQFNSIVAFCPALSASCQTCGFNQGGAEGNCVHVNADPANYCVPCYPRKRETSHCGRASASEVIKAYTGKWIYTDDLSSGWAGTLENKTGYRWYKNDYSNGMGKIKQSIRKGRPAIIYYNTKKRTRDYMHIVVAVQYNPSKKAFFVVNSHWEKGSCEFEWIKESWFMSHPHVDGYKYRIPTVKFK